MVSKDIPAALVVAACAVVAAALPLTILVFGAPISDPDPAAFVRLHLHPAFEARVAITFAYFAAIIALHWFIVPDTGPARHWYLLGFAFFLVGNGIDVVYRSIQFLLAHGVWAPTVLEAGMESAAAAKISAFNEIAPAITFSFSLFFAVGRLVMGGALIAAGGRLSQLCGAAIILNGLWNLATVFAAWSPFAGLGAIGAYYMWPWLAAILIAGALGWRKARSTA